jgi:hypothetical protein
MPMGSQRWSVAAVRGAGGWFHGGIVVGRLGSGGRGAWFQVAPRGGRAAHTEAGVVGFV